MTLITAQTLPWYLIGILTSALTAVFYAMLRGKIIPSRVADQLRESAEKRAEIAESGIAANNANNKALVEQLGRLMVFAENTDKVLKALHARAARDQTKNRGGSS